MKYKSRVDLPKLKHSKRAREYDKYSKYKISLVCKEWLFTNISYRDIDKNILNINSLKSKGFQSMGILRYLGMNTEFRGIFEGFELNIVIDILKNNSQDFSLIIDLLSHDELDFYEIVEHDIIKVIEAQKCTSKERRKRLNEISVKPFKRKTYLNVYTRNPDVVAEALYRASGICEKCGNMAPFNRKSNNTPYLEVHHIIPLSEQDATKESLDVLNNVLALCPNCHRKIHFG